MNKVKGQYVCEGCKYSKLHHCDKYDEYCASVHLYPERHQLACEKCKQENGYEFGVPVFTPEPNNTAWFHLPGIENLDWFENLIIWQKVYPEIFIPGRKVYEIYGAFPGSIWNGRSDDYGQPVVPAEDMEDIRQRVEDLGIRINLTWNNRLVEKYDVYDRLCNTTTQVFHNGKHAITVASPELFHYLKNMYPHFEYYQSVIQTEYTPDFTKTDALDEDKYKYDSYLMKRNWNNNWEELNKIPMEERHKYEFLCNDACSSICIRKGHYNMVNKALLTRHADPCGKYCTTDHDFMLYNAMRNPYNITPNQIDEHVKNGFCHFKLCSRGDEPTLLMYKVLTYMVKPEYHFDALCSIMGGRHYTEEQEHIMHEETLNEGGAKSCE